MSAANFVIKKNDGTTDVTYGAVASSAGDSSPAVWMGPYLSGYGNANSHIAQVRMVSRALPGGKSRQTRMTYNGPDVQSASAPYTVGSPVKITVIVESPEATPSTVKYEAISQALNAAIALKDYFKSGYAP